MTKTIKILMTLLILGFAFTNLSFAEEISVPENLDQAKEMGEQAIKTGFQKLPSILEKIWNESVLPVWKKMFDWFKVNIWLKIKDFFYQIVKPRITEEFEKRKPIIQQDFEEEKEELKEELPKITNDLWQRFKALWE